MDLHKTDRAGENGMRLSSRLGVIILYEDRETGLHAKESFNRFLQNVGFDLECNLDVCRFELIGEIGSLERASQQSSGADVVIVSLREGRDLPRGLRDWLNNWLRAKKDEPSALIFLVCRDSAATTAGSQCKVDFTKITTGENVEVFQCVRSRHTTSAEETLDEMFYRENSSSEVLDRILHRRDSFL